MTTALDRDALYYPYIHIRDVNWLKATLLCFPQVRRIVPPYFHLNDSDAVKEFRDVEGARGALLTEEPTDTDAVYGAQERLKSVLLEDKARVVEKFSRETLSREIAEKRYSEERDSFQIHKGKILENLIAFLSDNDLAWHARDISSPESENWYAVHPKLGEALMSVIAIAIAKDKGLDIVTSEGSVHHALASLAPDEVYNNLLIRGTATKNASETLRAKELADELAQVVMINTFDLSKLTAKQIGELTKDGYDLRTFKDSLIPIASSIPDISDPAELEKRLKEKAEDVIKSWEKYRKSLPRFALDALFSAANVTTPAFVTGMIGATSGIVLAGGVGLAVGLLTYSGYGIWRAYKDKTSHPSQFLSKIEKAGATLTATLTLPGAVTKQ